MTLRKAEQELTREYRSRQRRYASGVHGAMNGRNCFNEIHMAERITELENLVEALGGDTSHCLAQARS